MTTLAIANQKGGVGKSTLAVHLAWRAMERGHHVLLLDLDGQANSSRTFAEAFTGLTASTLFTVQPGALTEEPQVVSDQMSLIPADLAINDVEGLDLSQILWLAEHLNHLPMPAKTLCIIDTPPTLGRRLLAALIAADAVVSPFALNGYSIQGISNLQETIRSVIQQFNPGLRNLGLVANMVKAQSGTHRVMLGELREALGEMLFSAILHDRVSVSDAIDRGRPVWKGATGASTRDAGREMRAVCDEILGGLYA